MAELLQFPSPAPVIVDGHLPDAAERERALDVRASWIVEAPAGSGKTGLLIQRFLKLLGEEGVQEPEEVQAITFTRKATAEMRERVLGELEAAASGASVNDPFERETRKLAERVLARGWDLLERPRRLNIRTIDSVCEEIAQSLPVLSRIGGRLTPVLDADDLYREAGRRTLMHLGGQDGLLDAALRTMLLHRDGHLGNCEELIAEMLKLRDQWGRLVPLDRAELDEDYLDSTVLPRLEKALELAICQALTQLSRVMPEDVLADLTATAAEFAHLDGYKGVISPIALCANRNAPPAERAEQLAHWRALVHLVVTRSTAGWRKGLYVNQILFATENTHRARLKGMIDRLRGREDVLEAMCRLDKLPPAAYPPEQWIVARALFRVLSHALAELQMVFAEHGECDFAEMGLAARAALAGESGAEDLAAASGTKIRHLLVDEMQDTSTSQYELIERLTQGWDGQSRTVFLVGDPKQSIYRFRQARVERFVRTMKELRLGGMRLGCLRLTANFRSQRGLVERINEDFSMLFPPEVNLAHPEEVPFRAAVAMRGWGEAKSMVWHTAAVDADAHSARMLQAAREIRSIATEWLAKPLPPGRKEPWKVAVLVRSRAHLGPIVAELKRDDGKGTVPFRATEIDALGERQEVLDLLGLTRALLHEADRVAWLAVLHAPWCGLGLADLHMLAGADDLTLRERTVVSLIRERGHLLSEEGEERLARVWPVLEEAVAVRGRMAVAQLVERTWRSLGGDTYLDASERANAMRVFHLLDELEARDGVVDLARLKNKISGLYAEAGLAEDAVELITIHKAKGLEWDVVVVPALERMTPSDPSRLLEWMEVDSGEEEAAHVVLAPIMGTGEESSELQGWIKAVNGARERAERKRLLYVACTRARQELHLFASPVCNAKGKVKPAAGSLLSTAWPVAQRFFGDAAPELPEEHGGGLAIAASVEEAMGRPPLLHRLPLSFEPSERFASVRPLAFESSEESAPGAAFDRPEGSLEARAFGNAVHAFLQMAAEEMAGGPEVLTAVVQGWRGRVEAVLRGDGIAPALVERNARRVIEAILTTLRDEHGRWILAGHPGAANEVALTGWVSGARLSVRLDRMFYAAAVPGEAGADFLWIVDYKTASHGSGGTAEFLERERMKYQEQMETYARGVVAMSIGPFAGLRVALYYPVLGRLVWWVPESVSAVLDAAPSQPSPG